MKIISQGAEAIIYLTKNNTIKKHRVIKGYRVKEIDSELIKSRTKREIKVLNKIPINSPKIISSGDDFIEMEYVEGIVFKNAFNLDNCKVIGEMIADMHDSGIIHGDLTTSNIIEGKDGKIYFIDFGLSFFSEKIEDKAVDLHLLFHALESKHYKNAKEAFELVLEGYKKSPNSKDVVTRFKIVEKRGKNKH
ncbi:Kae1-associated kinase Bud32 [Candidatus Woesearchaeota archaeon]|nr:MAG: Kae1-associated kinase Bud32 [Candidatus Woesearchaeota archaeon]